MRPSTLWCRRRDGPAVNAAVCAALAFLRVLGGDMDTDFWSAAAQAVAKDQEARSAGAARIVGSSGSSTQLDGTATG